MSFNITPATFFSGAIAIADFLSNFASVDTVAIFDATSLQQVFDNARPLRADVKETSTIMSHPVETGAILSDHHIINQIEIQLTLFISSQYYNSVYEQIKTAFISATKLSVQTRTGVYDNMIIADIPHQEDTEMFDAIVMGMRLREVIYIVPTSLSPSPAPANYSPSDPVDADTVQAGQKYPAPQNLSTDQQSKLDDYLKDLRGTP